MSMLPQSEFFYQQAHIAESKQPAEYGVCITFFIIALVTAVLRLIGRTHKGQSLALDDYLLVAAMVSNAGLFASQIAMTSFGIGKHLITLNPDMFVGLLKWEVVNLYTYTATSAFVKLSILFLLLRIFVVHGEAFKAAVWFWIVYVALWAIGLFFANGFECHPFSRHWSLTETCPPSTALEYSGTILNALSDVACFLLPQPIIWRLQMPVQRKITISIIFAVGLIATIMGILKIVYVNGIPGDEHPLDTSYSLSTAAIFNYLEPTLAIICACLLSIPAFTSWYSETAFSRLTQSWITSFRSSKSNVGAGAVSGSESNVSRSTDSRRGASKDSDGNIVTKTEISITAGDVSGESHELNTFGHSTGKHDMV